MGRGTLLFVISLPLAFHTSFPLAQTTVRPYKFANVQLTDDDDIAVNEEKIIKAMGTIQIKVIPLLFMPRPRLTLPLRRCAAFAKPGPVLLLRIRRTRPR